MINQIRNQILDEFTTSGLDAISAERIELRDFPKVALEFDGASIQQIYHAEDPSKQVVGLRKWRLDYKAIIYYMDKTSIDMHVGVILVSLDKLTSNTGHRFTCPAISEERYNAQSSDEPKSLELSIEVLTNA